MNRIAELRLARNMTQAELGELINCAQITVSRYEKEQRELNPSVICCLCDIFGCTADYLLGRSNTPIASVSADEAKLLAAFRKADERAQAMVRLALEPYQERCEKENVS